LQNFCLREPCALRVEFCYFNPRAPGYKSKIAEHAPSFFSEAFTHLFDPGLLSQALIALDVLDIHAFTDFVAALPLRI